MKTESFNKKRRQHAVPSLSPEELSSRSLFSPELLFPKVAERGLAFEIEREILP